MKRPLLLACAAAATLFVATAAEASRVSWSIGVNVPPVATVVSRGPGWVPAPPAVVYSTRAPVYAPPAVVYSTPAPVYAPEPIVYDEPYVDYVGPGVGFYGAPIVVGPRHRFWAPPHRSYWVPGPRGHWDGHDRWDGHGRSGDHDRWHR